MDIEQIVMKFKIDLLRKMPFYGDILTRLNFKEDRQIPTACTDGLNIRYNPKYFSTLNDVGQINFVLMHEVFHVILLHTFRLGNRNPKVWNVACDLVVNSMLVRLQSNMMDAGIPFVRPQGVLYSSIVQNDTVENVYEIQMAFNDEASLSNSSDVIVKISSSWWNGDNTETVKAPHDLIISDGTLNDSESESGEDVPMDAEMYIRSLISDAVQKNRGTAGSFFVPEEIYSKVKNSSVNWKRLLKNYLTEKISDDSSYATPERKYLHMDLVLPGHCLGDGELEEVWAFVDSSGSVGKDVMERFLTELYRIVKEFKCILHICYWDTCVTDIYKNIQRENDVLKSIPRHSGGTNINCVYEWLKLNKVKPDVMVILTDGYFGKLQSEYKNSKLRKNTVLVLSTPGLEQQENIKEIGKVAEL